MSIDRPNLAGAFTKQPVDRAAALTGLLPPSRPPRPVAELQPQLQPEPEASVEPTITAPAISGKRTTREAPTRPSTPARRPVSDQATIVTNVAVYLEPDLLDLARERRRATGVSYDELTGDAFAAVTDDQLVRAFRPQPGITGATGMPTRQRRIRGTAGIQVQLRLDTNQRAWLDQKQFTVGAPSRSALVAAALRLHLTS